MKYAITILIIGNIILGTWLYLTNEKKNAYKSDLTHLNNSIDRMVNKKVNDAKTKVTDSLLKEFNEQPSDTIIKTQIIYRYDTITKDINSKSYNDQYRWSAKELERFYNNGLGVRFKSGEID